MDSWLPQMELDNNRNILIGRHESYVKDVMKIFRSLGIIKDAEVLHINQSVSTANSSHEDFDVSSADERLVQEFYREDYHRFSY
jgi:hypothetical protein